MNDLVGQTFGRLFVAARAGTNSAGRRLWRCHCACGRTVTTNTRALTAGETSSCGCYRSERIKALSTKHGHSPRYNHSRTYVAWRSMLSRCLNPKHPHYDLYGGRGVKVCARWRRSFTAFLADMGAKPAGLTLDRIDPYGNYTPSNCRWATWSEQRLNQRRCRAHA